MSASKPFTILNEIRGKLGKYWIRCASRRKLLRQLYQTEQSRKHDFGQFIRGNITFARSTAQLRVSWQEFAPPVDSGSVTVSLPRPLVALAAALGLAACASPAPKQPVQLVSEPPGQPPASPAYLWSSGLPKESRWTLYLSDVASIVSVDDLVVPKRYAPPDNLHALRSGLLEIPSGQRAVEWVVNEEIPSFCIVPCLFREVARGTFEFDAEAGQVYTPYAQDFCGRKWIWIEHSGPYVPSTLTEKLVRPTAAGGKVVAGEAPRPVIPDAARKGVPMCDPETSTH